ncbi:MAG: helix-turn-helix domain-containing protein [Fastidiosipilaceae bacterium]|jgi:DNA-binding Xre family transcriptional regulator
MAFDYSGLWKILKERKMRKEDLKIAVGMSSSTLAQMGKIKL